MNNGVALRAAVGEADEAEWKRKRDNGNIKKIRELGVEKGEQKGTRD